MPKVHTEKHPQYTTFRKLPFGSAFWLTTNLATTPFIKSTRVAYLGGYDNTTGKPTLTTVSDLSVAVLRVPRTFTGTNIKT